jgi:hypothetical protein
LTTAVYALWKEGTVIGPWRNTAQAEGAAVSVTRIKPTVRHVTEIVPQNIIPKRVFPI